MVVIKIVFPLPLNQTNERTSCMGTDCSMPIVTRPPHWPNRPGIFPFQHSKKNEKFDRYFIKDKSKCSSTVIKPGVYRVPFQYPIRRFLYDLAKSRTHEICIQNRRIPLIYDRYIDSRCTCHILERCDDFIYQSRGFETSRELTIRLSWDIEAVSCYHLTIIKNDRQCPDKNILMPPSTYPLILTLIEIV